MNNDRQIQVVQLMLLAVIAAAMVKEVREPEVREALTGSLDHAMEIAEHVFEDLQAEEQAQQAYEQEMAELFSGANQAAQDDDYDYERGL